jgi:hypothetical protein
MDDEEMVEAWNTKLWDTATDTLYLLGLTSEDGELLLSPMVDWQKKGTLSGLEIRQTPCFET